MSRLARIREQLKALNPVAIGVELLIVFIGVYLAFALQEARENRILEDRKESVLMLLKDGLVQFERLFGGYVLYHETENAGIRQTLEQGELPYFGGQFYAAPQYPIKTINYVTTNESFDVFDLELYLPLSSYANRIQQMMAVEAELSALGGRYLPVAPEDPRFAEQMQHARRYYQFMEARKGIAADLAERSRELIALLPGD